VLQLARWVRRETGHTHKQATHTNTQQEQHHTRHDRNRKNFHLNRARTTPLPWRKTAPCPFCNPTHNPALLLYHKQYEVWRGHCASARAVSDEFRGLTRVNVNTTTRFPICATVPHHRWLPDTSKRKLADFLIFFAPPPSCFPGLSRVWPDDGSKQALRIKKIGMLETVSRIYPKKGKHAPGKQKNRRFHAKSTSFLFKVSCSQLRGVSYRASCGHGRSIFCLGVCVYTYTYITPCPCIAPQTIRGRRGDCAPARAVSEWIPI